MPHIYRDPEHNDRWTVESKDEISVLFHDSEPFNWPDDYFSEDDPRLCEGSGEDCYRISQKEALYLARTFGHDGADETVFDLTLDRIQAGESAIPADTGDDEEVSSVGETIDMIRALLDDHPGRRRAILVALLSLED